MTVSTHDGYLPFSMHKRRTLVENGELKVVDIPCNLSQRITQSLKCLLEAAIESDKDTGNRNLSQFPQFADPILVACAANSFWRHHPILKILIV